eukprot:1186187-Prorocentrum_minimum.AAC.1
MSATSARVGMAFSIMDSSMFVATITGLPDQGSPPCSGGRAKREGPGGRDVSSCRLPATFRNPGCKVGGRILAPKSVGPRALQSRTASICLSIYLFMRVMLAGPKGRAVGESGELDTGCEKGKGPWGVECTLAVIGAGGPVK